MNELPAGWTRSTLSEACELVQDCEHRTPKYSERGAPALRPRDVVGGRLDLANVARVSDSEFDLQTRRYTPAPDDIVYSRELTLGWAAKVPNERVCLSQGMVAIRPGSAVVPDYVAHLLNGPGREHAIASQAGSAHPHLNLRDIRATPVPLAPLAEQDRIVAAIEEAFSKLDAGDAGLRTVRQLLKRMRAAVLAGAVTGRLAPQDPTNTPAAKLLADLGAEPVDPPASEPTPSGWAWSLLGDVTDIGGGIQKQPKRAPSRHPVPFLRVANVGRGTLDLDDVHLVEVFEGELARYALRAGDLLVVEGNGSADQIGRAALWGGAIEPCVHQNHLIRVRPTQVLLPAFLELYWNSPGGSHRVQSVASSTSGLHTLSTGKLKSLPVVVPPVEEQARIVAEVERQLTFLDVCERTAAAELTRSAALRRSVLKSAFAGRLVPQDPSDEPASVLLGRIRADRASAPKPARRSRRTP